MSHNIITKDHNGNKDISLSFFVLSLPFNVDWHGYKISCIFNVLNNVCLIYVPCLCIHFIGEINLTTSLTASRAKLDCSQMTQ